MRIFNMLLCTLMRPKNFDLKKLDKLQYVYLFYTRRTIVVYNVIYYIE